MFILFLACGEKDINEAPSSPQISFPSDPVRAGESLEVQFDEASLIQMVTKLLMNPFGISTMKYNLIYRTRWRFPKELFWEVKGGK